MSKTVEIEGQQYSFPDDATPDEIKAALSKNTEATIKNPAIGTVPVQNSVVSSLKRTAKNIPGSVENLVENTVYPFMHPVETYDNFKHLGNGVLQKLGITQGHGDERYADMVGRYFADRYGGIDKALDTLQKDPAGFLMDASTVLTLGGGAAERAPSIIGETGKAVSSVGRAIDPLTATAKATGKIAKTGVKGAGQLIGGVGTYTGAKPLQVAAESGAKGGEAAKAFLNHLRGNAPKEGIVADARRAVAQLRKQRGEAYRAGMKDVGSDKTILSFNDLDTAVDDMNKVATYKGQAISPGTEAIRDQIKNEIGKWKNLKAGEFWTPEGFDALKRKIGDIRDHTEEGSPARLVADQAYNAIKQTIIKQAPAYAHVMQGYETASDLIKQMEQTLKLNKNAPIDTTLRRLQSVLRDNVNTSYGYRGELADFLVKSGAPHLLEKIAGQALESWAPRGIGKLAASIGAGYGVWNHDLQDVVRAAIILGLSSPRTMGEAAHGLGTASRLSNKLPLQQLGQAGFQMGRADNLIDLLNNSNAGQNLFPTQPQ